MTDPQVGDIVDITIKGARVNRAGGPGFTIFDVDGYGHNLRLMTALTAITVTVVEPATSAEWPPRPGDLWRDRDQELWFATTAHVYRHGPDDFPAVAVVELVHAGGGPGRVSDEVNRECGPLQLVHREQGEPTTVGSWPPKVGEVWTCRGGARWTAFAESGGVSMRDDVGNEMSPEGLSRRWGPITFVCNEQEPEEAPAVSGWPPRAGDVWRDSQGDDWHAVGTIHGVRMRLDGTAGSRAAWHVLSNYGPLQLVKR